jgi:hypothetical protein
MQFLHESNAGSGDSVSSQFHQVHKPFISFRPARYSRILILRHLPCKGVMEDISLGHDDEQKHRAWPDPFGQPTTM